MCYKMKCFPKLLDKKNYLEFSTMIQIPRFGSDPYLLESEPPGQWLGESYVLQAPSIVLSIREFGNTVLRTVLCTRYLSYGPEQYSIPKPPSILWEWMWTETVYLAPGFTTVTCFVKQVSEPSQRSKHPNCQGAHCHGPRSSFMNKSTSERNLIKKQWHLTILIWNKFYAV